MSKPTSLLAMNLPDPILLGIFRCHFDGPAFVPPRQSDDRESLMLVSHRWRNLIQFTPEFWTWVNFLPVISQIPGRLENLARTWLQRSLGVLVYIEFETDMDLNTTTLPPHYVVYGAGRFCVVDTVILPCAPRIVSLKFHGWEFAIFNVFRNLPCLQAVKLCILNAMPVHPGSFRLPWRQLTHLYLGTTAISPDAFLHIIDMTSLSLLDAIFRIKFTKSTRSILPHGRALSGFTPIVANLLKGLQLILIDASPECRIFKALILPALVSFQVKNQNMKTGWDLGLYMPLIETTFQLEYLSFLPFSFPLAPTNADSEHLLKRPHRIIPSAEMESLFAAIPTVKTLVLGQGLHLNLPTLTKIAQGELLPSLENLRIGSMVGVRNDLATYRALQPQGSGGKLMLTLSSISVVHLLVPEEDEEIIEKEAMLLRESTTSCVNVKFIVDVSDFVQSSMERTRLGLVYFAAPVTSWDLGLYTLFID
ncbi:hypothetical protein GALMADRAFT_206201 [Galerina marginata CBS 339.88]|uniref:Uncharacterized protein n=1 Tax=Galerina marginata (strain CBS 339.88) TaxID=685588 RepID=A0A067TN76_GALM3|nr:hypothetical protein GALMADRAFT_206201 [Galerina marginata CBS 339.88]